MHAEIEEGECTVWLAYCPSSPAFIFERCTMTYIYIACSKRIEGGSKTSLVDGALVALLDGELQQGLRGCRRRGPEEGIRRPAWADGGGGGGGGEKKELKRGCGEKKKNL